MARSPAGAQRDSAEVADRGSPWRDLPERYRPWETAHERLRLWTADCAWDKILAEVIVRDDAVREVEWVISVDSSVVRAHQHAAGAREKGGCTATVDALAVEGEGLGRSRGGLSTKIHLAVDRRAPPRVRSLQRYQRLATSNQLVPSSALRYSPPPLTSRHGPEQIDLLVLPRVRRTIPP